MRWRSFGAEMLECCHELGVEHGRDARRAARRLAAHPAGAGHAAPRRTPELAREPAAWSSRATRARPASSASSGRLQPAPACPRCRSGRRCRTTSRSRRAPRRPWRCSASSRTCSTSRSRSVTCPRRPGPGSAASTSWRPRTPRSPTTSARSRRPRTPPTCPRRSGDAIAREFERYLAPQATNPPQVTGCGSIGLAGGCRARRVDGPRRTSPGAALRRRRRPTEQRLPSTHPSTTASAPGRRGRRPALPDPVEHRVGRRRRPAGAAASRHRPSRCSRRASGRRSVHSQSVR